MKLLINSYWNPAAVVFCFSIYFFCGCKKLIEVDAPIETIVGKEIYNNNTTASTVLIGMYATMAETGSFIHGLSGIPLRTGLSGDELVLFEGNTNIELDYFYQNQSNSLLASSFWSSLYRYVFQANGVLEGVAASTKLSDAVKTQLVGEAKFIRAFCYFYLVNFYGDVPLLISTDTKINSFAPRMDKRAVYEQIVKDLEDAQQLLSIDFVDGDAITNTSERVRPSKMAATALLARVYLYLGEWAKAEEQASSIISDNRFNLVALQDVFKKNSLETIWALQSRTTFNNDDAVTFNLISEDNGPSNRRPVYLSDGSYIAFGTGDNRKTEWVKVLSTNGKDYPYAHKYKTDANTPFESITEYPIILRLGEQYLIRAEARARQNKLTGIGSAAEDLDAIRARAGLTGIIAATQSEMLDAIYGERRTELFTEGHRWLDLKRTGKIDEVMSAVAPVKGGSWANYKALYPIPPIDIRNNPSLRGHQNSGYPEL